MYDEKYVRNYIEINLNEGKSLSEIKQELMEKEVPVSIMKYALSEAYEDERRYLQRVQQDQGQGRRRIHIEKLWWLFVLIILAIITASVIAIKRYLLI